MKRGWAENGAAGNAKSEKSQSESSTMQSMVFGPPRITLPYKDALDPDDPCCQNIKGCPFTLLDSLMLLLPCCVTLGCTPSFT